MEWIVTDNIRRETWRRMLEFSNTDLAVAEIESRHGKATAETLPNYKKQAQQIRVCVLQAKEYFDAAAASTIFTSPNHLYYGAVSLASMMMLILGKGTSSLDFLRNDPKNHHHGLRFTTGCTAKTVTKDLTLIQNSFGEVLPRGHFANWYATLPPMGRIHALHTTLQISGTPGIVVLQPANTQVYKQVGSVEAPTLDSMIGLKKSVLDLLKYIPDLSSDLYRYQIGEPRSRCTHTVTIRGDIELHQWAIHGAGSLAHLDVVLNQFALLPGSTQNFKIHKLPTNGALVSVEHNRVEPSLFRWPDCRDTMDHDTLIYGQDVLTHEIVDLYMICYQLSMMSRYFPDLWISCIESQCKAAKLLERAVDLTIKKLPILVLSMLSPTGLTISTHRMPWTR